eukprot:TRINITY_DN30420_c0_g1_i1.p1 TRINITY_DN30420_c0_g1~~TRINITY_DN30420_c0_g1_i1.p1  ORF type:complete len:251 (+),score=24.25 TRINITY_DN30420_c0_g1_i1:12-764(+)
MLLARAIRWLPRPAVPLRVTPALPQPHYLNKSKSRSYTSAPLDVQYPIEDLSHEKVLVCDSNLIIAYHKKEFPKWTNWVDDHHALHRKLFYLPRIIETGDMRWPSVANIHPVFQKLDTPHPVVEQTRKSALADLAVALKLTDKAVDEMNVDLSLILEVGLYVGLSKMISDEDIFNQRVFLASRNFICLQRTLGTNDKRAKFERVIDDHGLEHLLPVLRVDDVCTELCFVRERDPELFRLIYERRRQEKSE